MTKNEQTSKEVASKAAKRLLQKDLPNDLKSITASVLTQAPDSSKTTKKSKPLSPVGFKAVSTAGKKKRL